jgi:glycopeptide antibiotics resistance protein
MGVYPNFLAGLIMPMLFIFKYDKLPVPKVNEFDIKIKCIMLASIAFLIFEEYNPTFLASRNFDYWDILFSAVGSALFYLIYRKLKTSKLKSVEYD